MKYNLPPYIVNICRPGETSKIRVGRSDFFCRIYGWISNRIYKYKFNVTDIGLFPVSNFGWVVLPTRSFIHKYENKYLRFKTLEETFKKIFMAQRLKTIIIILIVYSPRINFPTAYNIIYSLKTHVISEIDD